MSERQPSLSQFLARWWIIIAAFLVAATGFPMAAAAAELRLTTENDLVGDDQTPDDLYTFSVGLEAELGAYTIALRENAFTDRAAGVRFDETYLSVGRQLPDIGPWRITAEAGAVHVGHGLLGEHAQNTVHRWIGGDEVHLRYVGSSLHPHLALAAERSYALGERLQAGPFAMADAVPGLRTYAIVGAHGRWQPTANLTLQARFGGRHTHASLDRLAPRLAEYAAVARLGVVLNERYLLSWSYNDYGDEREHLTVGYRLVAGSRTALKSSGRTSRSANRAGRE